MKIIKPICIAFSFLSYVPAASALPHTVSLTTASIPVGGVITFNQPQPSFTLFAGDVIELNITFATAIALPAGLPGTNVSATLSGELPYPYSVGGVQPAITFLNNGVALNLPDFSYTTPQPDDHLGRIAIGATWSVPTPSFSFNQVTMSWRVTVFRYDAGNFTYEPASFVTVPAYSSPSFQYRVTPVPELSIPTLLLGGLFVIGVLSRRR